MSWIEQMQYLIPSFAYLTYRAATGSRKSFKVQPLSPATIESVAEMNEDLKWNKRAFSGRKEYLKR